MPDFDLDVAVIGGGPGGLAVALALQRAVKGIKVKVFEKAKKYEPCGAGVALAANGCKAIKAICPDLLKELQDTGVHLTTAFQYDHTGKLLTAAKQDPDAMQKQWGVGGGVLGWYEIQQAIYERLPAGTVEFGQRFKAYTEDDAGVTLHFESTAPALRVKVVIGADGYFSGVRAQCLNDGPPTFAGTVMWRGRIPWRDGILPPGSSKFFFGAERVGLLYPINAKRIVWTVSAPVAVVRAAGVEFNERDVKLTASQGTPENKGSKGEQALENCRKVFAGHAKELVHVLETADVESVVEHGIYTRTGEEIAAAGLGKGRVTLVGDAAHPFRPTGQGLNTGMEDAAELAWYIQQQGLTAEALRAYEAARLPRMVRLAEHTSNQGASAYKKTGKEAVRFSANGLDANADYEQFLYGRNFHALQPAGGAGFLEQVKSRPVTVASAVLAAIGAGVVVGLGFKRRRERPVDVHVTPAH
ncbi:hypothetical protein WJX72_008832 [[Myrmecia] bisecta]|uniref:FAD-binding domain-containing protein n=1 Tax=[Myrmecia] bisecta TaxID=41462 RepID=A0AAW1QB44_9CHLO